MAENLPHEGLLSDTPFAEVVMRAAHERKSGWLEIRADAGERGFLFQNGLPVDSRASVPGESLAKIMVVRGKATREVVEGLGVPLLKDDEVRAALLERGLVTRDVLDEVRRFQLLLRLGSAFAVEEGVFRWQPATPSASPIAVNPYQMFSEGIAKKFSKERIQSVAATLADEIPRVAAQPPYALDGAALPPRAFQLFKRIDGRTPFGDIVGAAVMAAPPGQAAELSYRSWVYLIAFQAAGYIECGEAVKPGSQADEHVEDLEAETGPAETASPNQVMVVTQAGQAAVVYREIDDEPLNQRLKAMEQQNYFEVLDVAPDAADGQIKKAYFRLAKEFHPDRLYDHKERTVKRNADKAFSLVNRAYEQLRTPQGRKEYLQKIKELSEGLDLDKEAQSLLRSEVEFQKGVVYLRKRDFSAAYQQFQSALDLNPREADHFIYAGWAQFQLNYPASPAAWKEGVAKIQQGAEMDPKSADAVFFLGTIAKLQNDMGQAEALFGKVLRLKKDHVDAQRELRLIQQRKASAAAAPPAKGK